MPRETLTFGKWSLIKWPMESELIISKWDAARRQLETAILLYFNESDPIAIHTLTAAAYNVIRDINENQSGTPMFIKRSDIVRPEHVEEVRAKLNEVENFLKHADNDPDGVLKFKPAATEYLILDACLKYHELAGETVFIFGVFVSWFILNHQNLFNPTPEEERIYKLIGKDKPGRQEFLSIALAHEQG